MPLFDSLGALAHRPGPGTWRSARPKSSNARSLSELCLGFRVLFKFFWIGDVHVFFCPVCVSFLLAGLVFASRVCFERSLLVVACRCLIASFSCFRVGLGFRV